MKKIGLIIIFLAIYYSLSAQNESTLIKGTVTDKNLKPLEGAVIKFSPSDQVTTTDKNGKYEILVSSEIKYMVNVSYLGYEKLKERIRPSGSVLVKNYILNEDSYLIDEVIVKGIRASERTPIAMQTLTAKSIQKTDSGKDIPYQLSLTPSVVANSETGTGIGYTGLRIRGTDPSRINITVNGIPINDSESHGVFWVNMPDFTSSVSDVQIQRGVGSSTNGAAAFGATINFRTTGYNKERYARLSSSFGSYNTSKHTVNIGTGLIKDHFTFDMRYSELDSDGYIDRAFSDHKSLFLSSAYHNENTLVKANVIMGDQKTGITWWGVPDFKLSENRRYNPAGEYVDDDGNIKYYDGQTDNYKQNHYQLFISHDLTEKLNLNIATHYTTGEGYYEQYKKMNDDFGDDKFSVYGFKPVKLKTDKIILNDRVYTFSDSLVKRSDLVRRKWLKNWFAGSAITLNYTSEKIEANYGINFNRYDGDHFGKIKWVKFNLGIPKDYEWYRNSGLKDEFSSFLKIKYFLKDDLNIYGDIQYRVISYEMEGFDDDLTKLDQKHNYNFINPKIGIYYTPTNSLSLYGSYSVANREPARADIKEASKDGGNEFPKHETLFDYELGGIYKNNNLYMGINLYYMDYKDQLVNTGKVNSVGYKILENVEESYRMGIELTAGIKILENLRWEGNLTISKNKIKDYSEYYKYYLADWSSEVREVKYGKTDISYSPELIGASVWSYEYDGLSISLTSKYVGEQYFDNTSSEKFKLDDYLVHDINIAYEHKLHIIESVRFQLSINNFTSEKYENNANGGRWFEETSPGKFAMKTWRSYFPQAPMHFMFKTALTF